ncbi:unnamed protein product [Agarophyton chilense]
MFEERLAWSFSTTSVFVRRSHCKARDEFASTLVNKLGLFKNDVHSHTQRVSNLWPHFTLPRLLTLGFNQKSSRLLPFEEVNAITRHRRFSTATSIPISQINAPRVNYRLWLPTGIHTYKLGRLLGQDCRAGDVILLFGDLGVGKTALARGYIHSAHSDESLEITSPTYLLLNSYPTPREHAHLGIPEILHMDLWRLEDASHRPIVDFKTAFDQAACLIEWPDRLHSITPRTRLEIHMSYINDAPGVEPSEDDPWGFGIEDSDNLRQQCGRYVSLRPHGRKWSERVKTLIDDFTCVDEANRVTLVND